MTSKTSKKCYHELKKSGYLPNKQFEIYNQLSVYGSKTDEELDDLYGPHAHKRRADLYKKNLVEKDGTTKSEITGKIVYKWRVTAQGALPFKEDKKPTRAALIAKIATLEARDLSGLYDNGFKNGVIAAVIHISGKSLSPEHAAEMVNLICEAMQ